MTKCLANQLTVISQRVAPDLQSADLGASCPVWDRGLDKPTNQIAPYTHRQATGRLDLFRPGRRKLGQCDTPKQTFALIILSNHLLLSALPLSFPKLHKRVPCLPQW